ncbi:hypothetical protein THRCLA_08271 [Thraustotheca clavata]|uniref:Transmembrane protein n=1 Tax=Thraustotheca clavata TaxID=74557 RepID=A0A1V9Z7W9_9STRA|nr:hypothetical protein THRCLA_08271 [Thraustotheca clavata]
MSHYALAGIAYFLTHPKLWLMTLCPLLMTIVVGIACVVALFTVALYPQAYGFEKAGLAPGWAWVLSIFLVIIEIFLVTFIYSQTCTPCFMDSIFEKVLKMRGYEELVENSEAYSGCGRSCRACCKVSCISQVFIMIVTFPLNFIPIVGTIAYVYLNGRVKAWEYHLLYFEMRGYSYEEQKVIVNKHKLEYTSFGMQCMYLELIPFFGFIFLFTNTVGAALFAADLEAELRAQNYGATDPKGGAVHVLLHLMSLYAIAGILYFFSHPNLLRESIWPILVTLFIAIASALVMFTFGLYYQVGSLESAGFPAFWAWLFAIMLVLVEIFLLTLIYYQVCMACFMNAIFQTVLKMRGFEHLVERNQIGFSRTCCAYFQVRSPTQIFASTASLTLNFIPVIGNIAYVYLNGRVKAWEYHLLYFAMRGYSREEQKAIVNQHKLQYASFGMQCAALELVPILGFIFLFTNTVGAALFAADLEEQLNSQSYGSIKN